MRSLYWYAGFFVGLVVAAVVLLVTRKLMGKRKQEYDERQKLAQGQAYGTAFWTLLIFLAVTSLLQILFESPLFDAFTLNIIAIVLGVGVYAIVCILKDAYLPLRESPARFYLTGAIVIAANLAAVVGNLRNTPLLEDGRLTITSTNLLIVIMYVMILVVYAVKQWHDRRSADDEREER